MKVMLMQGAVLFRFRDTLIVVLGNCSTSLFAGFVIFPILGFISQIIGKTGSIRVYYKRNTRVGLSKWYLLFKLLAMHCRRSIVYRVDPLFLIWRLNIIL